MEAFISFFAIISPPFVAFFLVTIRRRSVLAYWGMLLLLSTPIISYIVWANRQPFIDRQHPMAIVAGAFLMIFCVSLPLTSLWFISNKWLKVILAPLIYIVSFLIAITIGVNLGMFEA